MSTFGQKPSIIINCVSLWYLKNFRGNLIEELTKYFIVHLITPDQDKSHLFSNPSVKIHQIILSRKSINPLNALKSFFQILKKTIQIQPQLVLNFTIKSNIYGGIASSILGIPYINNITGLGTAFIDRPLLKMIAVLLYKIANFQARYIVLQNDHDFKLMHELGIINPKKTKIIRGSGVDISYFTATEDPIQYDFLMIARIIKDKGVIEYCEAATRIKEQYPHLRFALIGQLDSQNRGQITLEVIKKFHDIEYLGETENILKYINISSVIVLPSYREGLSRVLIEAGACKKICITTNTPGCMDVISEGINGFLCEPKDSNSLAYAIERFIKMDKIEINLMKERSRIIVEENFSNQIITQQYLDIIII